MSEKTLTEKATDFLEEVKGKFYETKEKIENGVDEETAAINRGIDEKMATLTVQDNLSAVLKLKGTLTMEQRPIPKPGHNEVLIAMHSVGICGSDVHYYVHGAIGDCILKSPMVLGHESSGTVAIVGPGVTNLQRGDRVAIEPFRPCRYCRFCKTGRYNICPDVKVCATPPTDGTLSRYHVHPADFCYKLPDHVNLEEGALLEPLAVAVNACKRSNISSGDKVLICGAGPIGFMCLFAARAMGATKICMTDVDELRLQKAKNLGADHTFNVQCQRDAKMLAKQIGDLMGAQPDCSLECTGDEPSMQLAIFATRSGGVVQLVGLGNQYANIPILEAVLREVDIRGSLAYPNCYPAALAMVASGLINVKPLITHRFTLEDSVKAFNLARDNQSATIKVMIKCSSDVTGPAADPNNIIIQ